MEDMVQKDAKVYPDYKASSKADLLRYLKQQNIKAPPKRKDLSTEHRERWQGFRLLATWATGGRFSYPLKLIHQDKPDFLLSYNEHKSGIECTEAVSQEWLETVALAERQGKEDFAPLMSQFKRGVKLTPFEKRKIVQNQSSGVGEGWGTNGFDREWALCIMDSVVKKTEQFNKPDFKKYDENWLLVFDNRFVPPVGIKASIEKLIVVLKNYWIRKNCYDDILIETGGVLVEIHPSKWNQQPIVDLWT